MKMEFKPEPMHFAIAFDLRDYAKDLLDRLCTGTSQEASPDGKLVLYAAWVGNSSMVRLLRDYGANLDACNDRGRTPLHISVEKGHVEIAAFLLDSGIDAFVARGHDSYYGMPDESELPWTPAARAFARGDSNFEMAMVFHRKLRTPEQFNKALAHAASAGSAKLVEKLLENPSTQVNAQVKGTTSLYKACSRLDPKIIGLLLEAGADPNILRDDSRDHNSDGISEVSAPMEAELVATATIGQNALHALAGASSRHPLRLQDAPNSDNVRRCFELVLAHGGYVHQRDAQGRTPLHLADNASTARCLLDGGADPNAVTAKGETLLHTSFDDGVLEELLLETADLNLRTAGTRRTPLLYTLSDGYADDNQRAQKAMRLLKAGADPSAVDMAGDSALHLAIDLRAKDPLVLVLIERLCVSTAAVNSRNNEGKTPLHMNGPGSGRVNTSGFPTGRFSYQHFEALVKFGADPNIKDVKGQDVLFQMTQHSDYPHWSEEQDVVMLLVKAGARLDTHDSRGRTLLHAAICAHGNTSRMMDMVDFFVSKGLDPITVDHEGNTLMHEAMPRLAKRPAASDVLTRLQKHGISATEPNCFGRNPLHVISSFRPGAFDPCSSSTGPPSRPTNADEAPIFDHVLRLQYDIDWVDRYGVTALHLASTFSEYLTRTLLQAGADASQASDEGLTALHLAARSRQANIIGILIDWVASHAATEALHAALNAKDVLNRSPLYYAVASGVVESVELLVNAGADLEQDDFRGSAWNGCADFEEELARADWSRKVDSEDWRPSRRRKRAPGETDAGGVMLADQMRPEQVVLLHEIELPFPIERLEDIVAFLVKHASSSQDHAALARTSKFVDEARDSASDRGYGYTAACLRHARNMLGVSTGGDDIDGLQGSLEAQGQQHSTIDSVPNEGTIIDLLRSRDYAQVHALLDPKHCAYHEGRRGNATLLHYLIEAGFTSLASKAATTENIKRTEWHEPRDRVGWIANRHAQHVYPLIISACQRKLPNMQIVRMLVEEKGVDVNARMAGSSYSGVDPPGGPTALHFLAGSDCWWHTAQAIPYLVEHGADLEAASNGLTPLGYALQSIKGPHFSPKTVEALLKLGANANGSFKGKGSYLSATMRYPQIFELLLQHGATITQPVLVQAIRLQDVDLLRTMLANGADPNMRKAGREVPSRQIDDRSFTMGRHDPHDNEELYPLDFMAQETGQGRETGEDRPLNDMMFQMLLDSGADPFARYEKTTVMHRIMKNYSGINQISGGHNSYLSILFDQPDLRLETRDAKGMTVFLLACKQYFQETLEMALSIITQLLDLGADVRARDGKGRSALHHLCNVRRKHDAFAGEGLRDIEFVIGEAPDLVNASDSGGNPPLNYAVSARSDDLIDTLLAAGAKIDYADSDGNTFLHHVLSELEWDISLQGVVSGSAKKYLTCALSLDGNINARNSSGETPLFAFFRAEGSRVIAEVPLAEPTAAQAKEEGRSGHGYLYSNRYYEHQQLQYAAGIEQEHLVLWFLEQQGADWTALSNSRQSLLHIVAQDASDDGRRVKRFAFLMSRGLDPRSEDDEHRTPLDLAAALGFDDVLALFKQSR